jgi:hypothetical protein
MTTKYYFKINLKSYCKIANDQNNTTVDNVEIDNVDMANFLLEMVPDVPVCKNVSHHGKNKIEIVQKKFT